MNGLQPTAEPLTGPQEPTPACPPWAGADRVEEGTPSSPCSGCQLCSLVLDLGPLGFQGQVLQEKRKQHRWGGSKEADLSTIPWK